MFDQGRFLDLPRTLQRLVALVGLRREVSRAQAVGALWPAACEDAGLGRLRTALRRLRKLGALVVRADGELLVLDESVQVDVDQLVDSDEDHLLCGPHELLPGWYEDWVLSEREGLRQRYLHTLETVAARRLREARYGEALDAAFAAMRAEPLREAPHRLLVRIQLAEGDRSEALTAYRGYRDPLHRELGIVPSPW